MPKFESNLCKLLHTETAKIITKDIQINLSEFDVEVIF